MFPIARSVCTGSPGKWASATKSGIGKTGEEDSSELNFE